MPQAPLNRSSTRFDLPALLDAVESPLPGVERLIATTFPSEQPPSSARDSATPANPPHEASDISQALARRKSWADRRIRRVDPQALAEAQRQEADNDALVRAAMALRGTPYRWGGASRGGFDCSGFTRYIYAWQRGVMLPHSSRAQARCGIKVRREDLRPGDLLFFGYSRRGISHVGMYIGDGEFIHAASHRRNVRVDRLSGHYSHRLVAARRVRIGRTAAQSPEGREADRRGPGPAHPTGEPPPRGG
ncbi:MAG: C40 family peptidase [Armatimonadetes bacterium]|nr:C40 family peptidase [Armatimonadota bacterium]